MRKRNKEKQRGYQRTFYRRHSVQVIAEVETRRDRIRVMMAEAKSAGCARCGYSKCPAALEFHHITDDKELSIANAISRGWSEKRIREEIAKCVLWCANCHREHHHCEHDV